MGKGIAVFFRDRWPAMYREYRARCADGRFTPGDVFVWDASRPAVLNLCTEKHWRTGATLDAIERSLRAMVAHCESAGLARVGMPRIGAGYGGLAWEAVRDVIERVGAATPVLLVVVSLAVPSRGEHREGP